MPATIRSLGIDRLSLDERLVLVREIWDSIAADGVASRLSEEQRQELRRRTAEDDADLDGLIPLDAVMAKALGGVHS